MTASYQRTNDAEVIDQLIGVARRRWKLIAACVAVALAGAFVYAELQPRIYASSATVMVRSGPAADPLRQGAETTSPEEEGQFLSQLELAKSKTVATIVANQLDLANDPTFAKAGEPALRRQLRRLEERFGIKLGLGDKAPVQLDEVAVIGRLQSGIKALRVGRTYVAALSYSHADPAVAQKVAQAFAEAFRQKMSQDNDLATSRLRATLQGEADRAAPADKPAIEARMRELMISRALPGMDVAILSDASLPGAPIAPRTGFILAVGAILGAAIGAALAGLRELGDRGVRDGSAAARALGQRFLGYLPKLGRSRDGSMTMGKGQPLPASARMSVTEPFSPFSETIRAMGVGLIAGHKGEQASVTGICATVGVTDTTAILANLASHLANQGRSVLMIDGNIRDPRLTRWLAAEADLGLIDHAMQNAPSDESILYDSKSNLSLLPMVLKDRMVEPTALFASQHAQAMLQSLRSQYQHILVDLAPLGEAADAAAIAAFADNFVLVSRWGGASVDQIEDVLARSPEVRGKLVGLAIADTDLKRLGRYVR